MSCSRSLASATRRDRKGIAFQTRTAPATGTFADDASLRGALRSDAAGVFARRRKIPLLGHRDAQPKDRAADGLAHLRMRVLVVATRSGVYSGDGSQSSRIFAMSDLDRTPYAKRPSAVSRISRSRRASSEFFLGTANPLTRSPHAASRPTSRCCIAAAIWLSWPAAQVA